MPAGHFWHVTCYVDIDRAIPKCLRRNGLGDPFVFVYFCGHSRRGVRWCVFSVMLIFLLSQCQVREISHHLKLARIAQDAIRRFQIGGHTEVGPGSSCAGVACDSGIVASDPDALADRFEAA